MRQNRLGVSDIPNGAESIQHRGESDHVHHGWMCLFFFSLLSAPHLNLTDILVGAKRTLTYNCSKTSISDEVKLAVDVPD